MIEIENNSNVEWKVGDKVESVGGLLKDGEVLEIKTENNWTLLKIKWENGLIQTRSDRIVRKK